jgi:DNA-binding MarR family transcriptional regulator
VDSSAADLARVIAGVRRCAALLTTISEEMIADLGLTAALRSVLEHLHELGPQTVPRMARERSVKRQSVQALVDQLREMGFVDARANPAHRRSVLIALTPLGREVFGKVRAREAARMGELLEALGPRDLVATARTLGGLRAVLRGYLTGG